MVTQQFEIVENGFTVTETQTGQVLEAGPLRVVLDFETGISIKIGEGLALIDWDEAQVLMRGIIRTRRKGPGNDDSGL